MVKALFINKCLFGVLIFSLLCVSCSKKNKQPDGTPKNVPSDFSIRFGEGGGFTGLWKGYTIQADGTILSWQGRMAGENPKIAGQVSVEQVQALWQEIQNADFFVTQADQKGNMTKFMLVTANSKSHEVSWPGEMGQKAASAPNSLEQLQQFCQKIVEQAIKN